MAFCAVDLVFFILITWIIVSCSKHQRDISVHFTMAGVVPQFPEFFLCGPVGFAFYVFPIRNCDLQRTNSLILFSFWFAFTYYTKMRKMKDFAISLSLRIH